MTQLNNAFDLAVHNGYKGTRHDWLAALKRDKQNVWWRRWLDKVGSVAVVSAFVFGLINLWLLTTQISWDMYVTAGYKIPYLVPFQLTVVTVVTVYTVIFLRSLYKKA